VEANLFASNSRGIRVVQLAEQARKLYCTKACIRYIFQGVYRYQNLVVAGSDKYDGQIVLIHISIHFSCQQPWCRSIQDETQL